MKKVININIGSIVFAIEQEAYDVLVAYLESIKQSISDNDDASEIVEDIESAIAEKFLARKRSEKVAVTNDDVSEVITELGSPADFGEGAEEMKGGEGDGDETQSESNTEIKKRLYRDTEDAVIAGVASGLARYFDIDPVFVRILFAVSIFFSGIGIVAYLLLWLIVPAAETTAQKYAMRGEKVTVMQITERVKKKIDELDTDALKNNARNTWGGLRPVFVKLFEVFGILARALLSIFRYTIGFAFLLGGALSLAGLISMYSIVLLSDKTFLPADAQTALDIMLNSSLGIVAISASFVMMLIPLLALMLIGRSIIAKKNLFTGSKSIAVAVVWIVAAVLAGTTSILQVEKVVQVIDPEAYESGQYQLYINIDNGHRIEIDAELTAPIEEEVESAPPTDEVLDLPTN